LRTFFSVLNDSTQPFRTWKRILELFVQSLGLDDISKARIEEAIFTSPRFMALKDTKSISLKQEQELLSIIQITQQLLAK